jgi:Niemann-Pick C1 protein
MASCTERFGDKVEGFIGGTFHSLGSVVGLRPKQTIMACIVLTIAMGFGFTSWEVENRAEELWVPQDTTAEAETEMYQDYFQSSARISSMIVQSSTAQGNVLTKANLEEAMKMHDVIATRESIYEEEASTFTTLCVKAGGSCATPDKFDGVCQCLVNSILKQWDYDLAILHADDDILATINQFGTQEDLEAVVGDSVFEDGQLVSAEAFTLSYFLQGDPELVNGNNVDPVNELWELDVFLDVAESVPEDYPSIATDYFTTRSFGDEFGEAITGDLLLVQVSYVVAFLFLGANLGNIKCGTGSRWTMALGALATVGISTAAGFGLSSIFGLFFGPVHSLLPFILLGIGVDDAFVIVNAFNRERKGPRTTEDNEMLRGRCARALARAGASITVTSATDLVAFGISSSSSLPALASFCAYAAISIFFLWLFASTFFTATLVLDERRQRDNRRECLCCVTRKVPIQEDARRRRFRRGYDLQIFPKLPRPRHSFQARKGGCPSHLFWTFGIRNLGSPRLDRRRYGTCLYPSRQLPPRLFQCRRRVLPRHRNQPLRCL